MRYRGGVSLDVEQALAAAWIAAQDDLDDLARIDSVRVAADRLQAAGHPLGELVTLGLAAIECGDPAARARLQAAHLEQVAALLPAALGVFATLVTHPQVFDMRWSLCYLERARLPLHTARRYAGLLGFAELDPAGMLDAFLVQPGARCLRSLTLDLGRDHDSIHEVLAVIARHGPPIETLAVHRTNFPVPAPPVDTKVVASWPYLHTLVVDRQLIELPDGDPNLAWTGQPSSIRALGRAGERALQRIVRMGHNSGRYLAMVQAHEPYENRRALPDRQALLRYVEYASSLDQQRQSFESDPIVPRWSLRARWRALVPNGAWFVDGEMDSLLREHNRLHDSPELEPLSIEAMREDSMWIEFRRQAESIKARLSS